MTIPKLHFGGLYLQTHGIGDSDYYTASLVDYQSGKIAPGEVRLNGVRLGESELIERLAFTINPALFRDGTWRKTLPGQLKWALHKSNLMLDSADAQKKFTLLTPWAEMKQLFQIWTHRMKKPPAPVSLPAEEIPKVDVTALFKHHRKPLLQTLEQPKYWRMLTDRTPSKLTGKAAPNRIYFHINPFLL